MTQIESTQNSPPRASTPLTGLRAALLAAFLLAAGLTAYFTFIVVRDYVTSQDLPRLPGNPVQETGPIPDDELGVLTRPDVPLQPDGGPEPPAWQGGERISVLIIGLDTEDGEGDAPPRTDSLILMTVDPLARTAGMLSIPRDLWVNIPGYDYGRISTAYQLGEANAVPGGGTALVMHTVEGLLGVPVPYYARVDPSTYERIIDEIEGVEVDVPQPVTIGPLTEGITKTLEAGVQTLNGEEALAYVQGSEGAGEDLRRAERRQQLLLSIRDRILDTNRLPDLIAKSGLLYAELSDNLATNLTLEQVNSLAWLASQIPEENIRHGVIGTDHALYATSTDEAGNVNEVLKPITENIRLLRDEIFVESGPLSPATLNMAQIDLVKAENARVAVYNGSSTPGLGARTSDYLKSVGLNVTTANNAEQARAQTEITFYTAKPYTVKYLAEQMGVDSLRIFHHYDPASPVDVVVVLGSDWAANNTMPPP